MTRRQYAKVLEKEPLIQNQEFPVPLSCPRATSPMDTTVSSVSAALLGVPRVYSWPSARSMTQRLIIDAMLFRSLPLVGPLPLSQKQTEHQIELKTKRIINLTKMR